MNWAYSPHSCHKSSSLFSFACFEFWLSYPPTLALRFSSHMLFIYLSSLSYRSVQEWLIEYLFLNPLWSSLWSSTWSTILVKNVAILVSSAIVNAEWSVCDLVQFFVFVLNGTALILVGLVLEYELFVQAVVRRVRTTELLRFSLFTLEIIVVLSEWGARTS